MGEQEGGGVHGPSAGWPRGVASEHMEDSWVSFDRGHHHLPGAVPGQKSHPTAGPGPKGGSGMRGGKGGDRQKHSLSTARGTPGDPQKLKFKATPPPTHTHYTKRGQ